MTAPPSKFLSHPQDLGLLAVGFSGGQCRPGTEAAPSALLSSGLVSQLTNELGYNLHHDDTIHTYSDLLPSHDPPFRNMKNPIAVSNVCEKIASQVYDHSKEGRLVLTLGGDHSIAIGTVSGVSRGVRERLQKDVAVVWVDAHADINTPESSESGNIHGMPLAFLTHLAHTTGSEPFSWCSSDAAAATTAGVARRALDPKKLVYIGLRDLDAGEKKILREQGIKAFSMHDVDRHGIGRVMDLALEYIGAETPIHLSFDVDALDPMWAPSTGTPVRGGLTLREGDFICESVALTGQLVAVDLVEVNPKLEVKGMEETVRAGVSLVRCALGDTLL